MMRPYDREVSALIKLRKVLPCSSLIVITRDEERTLDMKGVRIDVIPIWKWLLEEK